MLERQKIMSIFVEMSCKSMPKRVACKFVFPAEFFFGQSNMMINELGINRFVGIVSLREKIITGVTASAPIILELLESKR